MVVIDRKEFVVILLADLVADDLPVDDGRHLVLALYGGRVYGYLARPRPPCRARSSRYQPLRSSKDGNIPSIDGSSRTIRHLLPELVFQWGEDFLLLLLTLRHVPPVLRVQTKGDTLLLSRSAIVTLSANPPDNPVQDFQPLLDRCSSMELEVRTAVSSSVRS